MDKIEEIVLNRLVPAKNFIYGFADLTGLLNGKFYGYNYAISIGRQIDNRIIEPVINGATNVMNSED
jgi:hypothetical protein